MAQSVEARFLWWGRPDKLPRRVQQELRALAGDSLDLKLHLLRGDGRELVSLGGGEATAPASLAKLLSCAAAFECLPDSLPFRTGLALEADSLAQGLLLRVVCGGAPDLGDSLLRREVRRLLEDRPDSLPVAAVIHAGRYDRRGAGPGWMWDDGDGAWAARVSAATINGNCVIHRLDDRRPGRLLPRLVGAEGTRTGVQAGLDRPRRDWQGRRDSFRVPPWAAIPPRRCNVEHPDSLFARLLLECIESAGHPAEGFPRIEWTQGPAVDHILPGLPLSALADSILHHSWNLGAECLFQECEARADSIGRATWEGAAVRQGLLLRALADSAGRRLPAWRVVDGSGMSRYNAAPMRLFTEILFLDQELRGGRLTAHLPEPGEGTLEGRFSRLPKKVSLRAKTGSLRGKRLLAGVMQSESDARDRLYFAFCLEGYLGSSREILRLQEEIVMTLSRWLEEW